MESSSMVRCAHMLMRGMKDDLQETNTIEPVFVLLQVLLRSLSDHRSRAGKCCF